VRGLLMGRHRSPADTRNAFDGHSWDLAGIDRVWRETAGRAPLGGRSSICPLEQILVLARFTRS
jgi:hypothetical protein